MAKENFVRDKPHVSTRLAVVVLVVASAAIILTLLFPAFMLPGSLFIEVPRVEPAGHLTALVLVNAGTWTLAGGLVTRLMPNKRPHDHVGNY